VDGNGVTRQELAIDAADVVEPDEALLIDVGDDEADLVRVCHHGHLEVTVCPDARPHVAQGVGLWLRHSGQALAHDAHDRALEACGTRRLGKGTKKLDVERHGRPPVRDAPILHA
jgi:hypothetical protein